MKKHRMKKRNLQNGVCAWRWSCKNINKECCNPIPVGNNTYVECDYYEKVENPGELE